MSRDVRSRASTSGGKTCGTFSAAMANSAWGRWLKEVTFRLGDPGRNRSLPSLNGMRTGATAAMDDGPG
ncbi:hypothetical protein GCM10010383_38550 [Streptomyces lomondensis]|uniref:Uncharacterized protein n=1 Tax=Streptomyces lomondensis TaxID=68229 RepID=A0ABQ2X8R4_9ACTN|nr:hypothetical protein GCM10010383_38550 [Streptomyces lomondensis]